MNDTFVTTTSEKGEKLRIHMSSPLNCFSVSDTLKYSAV